MDLLCYEPEVNELFSAHVKSKGPGHISSLFFDSENSLNLVVEDKVMNIEMKYQADTTKTFQLSD